MARISLHFSSYGISYTTFEYSGLSVSSPKVESKEVSVTISVKVKNTGSVSGSETIQVYVSLPTTSELTHPPKALKAFKKAKDIKPGETRTIELALDKYAFSYWEARINSWTVESGDYSVYVGPSSASLPLNASITIQKGEAFEWNGL